MGWVVQKLFHRAGWEDRLRTWFPDREFFMRSQGQVKFLRISAQFQMRVAAIVAAVLVLWVVATLGMVAMQFVSGYDRADLAAREARVASSENRVAAYRESLDDVTADLERRQKLLESLTEQHLGADLDALPAANSSSKSATEAARTVDKVSALFPEAAGLARLEARQLAYVERLTLLVDARARRAEAAIRKLGLNPAMMIDASTEGQGGPLLPFFGDDDDAMDPRFERLSRALERMSAMERSLKGIPTHLPAGLEYISSGFGYRRDPFTGAGAMHSGLDFRGPHGAPILAAAQGRVSFAGVKSGYGNTIEIDHGNGLMTRYAHLSSFDVRVGQPVSAGMRLGGMGSTGRSTGTHLHFEVRVNGTAINPRPFLEANNNVLAKAQQSKPSRGQQSGERPRG